MDFQKFDTCLKLRTLGFPQKRKFQSMYYVRPDTLICIDDLSALKNDGETDFENIFDLLFFKPRLEDLIAECDFLDEFIQMADGSWMAYSKIEEDPAYIEKTGRQDKMIRAQGNDCWQALCNLYIAVKSKDRHTTLTPDEVAGSENQVQATEPNP